MKNINYIFSPIYFQIIFLHDKVFSQISFSEGKNFELTLYFLNKIEIWSDEKLTKSIASTIYKRLENPGLENVLFTFYNPLKIVILLIEFLEKLSQKIVYNRSTLIMISKKIYSLAQLLISKLNDDKELNIVLRDTDLEQRRVIYIIYENNLWEIIGMQNVENVIDILWNGSILTEFDLLSIFSVSSNLFASYNGPNYPQKENLYFARNPISDFQHHFTFQRVVWTYNCRIRLFLDNFIMIFCFFLTVIGIEKMQLLRISFFNEMITDEKDPAFQRFIKEIFASFDNYMVFFIIYLINFPIRLASSLFYSKKLEIHYKINIEDIFDILLSVLSIITITFFMRLENFSLFEIDIWMKTIFCSFIVLIVIKTFFCLKIIRMFGPWLKALWVIFQVCMKFMIIFMITVLCFAFLGHISFFDHPNQRFKSVLISIYYLIEVSGSQFSLIDDYKSYKTVFGPLFLIIYIFVICIIYMNLVIAILSFNFEAASKVGRMHFNHSLIGSIRKFEYDPIYGCLVIMPIYLSFLNIIFLFFALFIQNAERLRKINKIFCRIGYFPISITTIIILVAINSVLIPCNFFDLLFWKKKINIFRLLCF